MKKLLCFCLSFLLLLTLASGFNSLVWAEGETETQAMSTEESEKKECGCGCACSSASMGISFPTQEEALEELGLERVPQSVTALSWVDCLTLLDASAPIAALPEAHHLPEEIQKQYEEFSDHDGNINYDLLKEKAVDLLFVSAAALEKNPELKAKLDEMNIEAVEMPMAKNFKQVLQRIALVSALFGTEEQAMEKIAEYEERIAEAKESLSDAMDRKVAVLSVTKEGRTVLGRKGFIANQIRLLGLQNAAAEMELDKSQEERGFYPLTDLSALKEAGVEALVIMVRIKGDKEAREAEIAKLTEEIKTVFGEDSELVQHQRYEVIDHHGLMIAAPNAIAGLENIADIASR